MALDPRRRVPTTFNKPTSRSTAIVPSASRAVAVGPRPVRRSTTRNPRAKRRLDSVFDDWQYKKRKSAGASATSSGSRAIVPVGSRAIVPAGARPSRPSGSSRPTRPSRPAQPSRKRPASRTSSSANLDRVVDQMSRLTRQYDREMEKLTKMMRNIQMRNKRARR